MDIYILKSAACLAAFYLFYKLFLENENMHFFKRFFLIGTLALSFLIPLFTFTMDVDVIESISPFVFANVNGKESNSFLFSEILPSIIWTIYLIGVLFFSIRFGKNLITLILKIK